MPTRRELRETAEGLGRIIEKIAAGELDASPAYLARLEGARAALEALAGMPLSDPPSKEGE